MSGKKNDETFIHPTAVILGDVKIGKNSSIWPGAVLRGDFNTITIGEYTSIQDNCVVHTTPFNPTKVGDYVTVGHTAVLHACTIEDNVLIGMNATVLDGSVVGSNSIVAAGTVVPPGTRVPEGSLVIGVPGKVKEGKANPQVIRQGALSYFELSRRYLDGKETFPTEELIEMMGKYSELIEAMKK